MQSALEFFRNSTIMPSALTRESQLNGAHFSHAPSPKLCLNCVGFSLCHCGFAPKKCLLDILSESLRGKKDTDGFLSPSFSESDVKLRYKRAQSCLVTIFSLSASEEDMQVTVWDVPADKVVFQVDRLVFPCLIQFRQLLALHRLLRSVSLCCGHRDIDALHDAEKVCGSDRVARPCEGEATLSQGMQLPCRRKDHEPHTLQSAHRWSKECFRQDVGRGSSWRGMVPAVH